MSVPTATAALLAQHDANAVAPCPPSDAPRIQPRGHDAEHSRCATLRPAAAPLPALRRPRSWRRWTLPAPLSSFPAMLPHIRDYDRLYREFRWQIPRPLQHRRRRLRPLGGARPAPARDPACARRRPRRRGHLRLAAETSEPARQCAARARHRARRPRRDPAAADAGSRRRAMSRSTSSAPWRCRSRSLFGPTRCRYRLQNSGAKARDHQRARRRQARARSATTCRS